MIEKALFIGRFQPFHNGHKKIVDTLIGEDKIVVIGIRRTRTSEENPYTYEERHEQIREFFPIGSLIEIMGVPDISEVVYGRDVGYKIREIRLDQVTEGISATAIRKAKNMV